MTRADRPELLPPGWPKGRYHTTHRAMTALRIADHLLRRGLAYSSVEATDHVIRTAAAECGQHEPSSTTCTLVRAVLDFLIPSSSPTASSSQHPTSTVVAITIHRSASEPSGPQAASPQSTGDCLDQHCYIQEHQKDLDSDH